MNIERWQKRPVVIEAVRFLGFGALGNGEDILHWIDDHGAEAHGEGREMCIATLEGDHWARPGDWIIHGVVGEFYPVKPDVFEATYDPVPS